MNFLARRSNTQIEWWYAQCQNARTVRALALPSMRRLIGYFGLQLIYGRLAQHARNRGSIHVNHELRLPQGCCSWCCRSR